MDKAALLDAIAQSGSAGKAAYEQAQQNLAAQQAEAIRGALASGVAGQAGAGAQAQLAQIAGQPYESRVATLQQNQAAMQDWYNRLGAARGSWADQQQALQEVALQQALAQASGGGGGGGGGKTQTEPTWYETLRDTFGTAEIAKSAIPGEAAAAGLTDWKTTGNEPIQGVRDYASFVYNVPESTAAEWYPQPEFASGSSALVGTVRNPKTARRAIAGLRLEARNPQYAGQSTGYYVRQARKQISSQYPQAAKQGWRKPKKYAKKQSG